MKDRLKNLREKMVREPLPPEDVAAGWALGMFIGCSVPFGLQLIVSVPLAMMMRVSKIGATVGTLITNPVTIFFIYPVQIWTGAWLLGKPLDWTAIQGYSERLFNASVFSAEGWHALAELGGIVLGGFFLGGFLLAAVCTPVTYIAVKRLVEHHRARKSAKQNRMKAIVALVGAALCGADCGEILPLFGDYADGFWERSFEMCPANYQAAFRFKATRQGAELKSVALVAPVED